MTTFNDYVRLVNEAKAHSYRYYVESAPTISDAEFDALVSHIENIEEEHSEWVLKDSPTQIVGSDLSGNGRKVVAHRTPMLSCQKAQTVEKVDAFLRKADAVEYAVEWKYDGISCSLVYIDGQLVEASTRGDGDKGQDILRHVMLMPSVPKNLAYTGASGVMAVDMRHIGRIEVRGEILCPHSALPSLHDKNGRIYKDTRTAASALCNQEQADIQCEKLEFHPWEVFMDDNIFTDEAKETAATEAASLSFLNNVGFKTDVEITDGRSVKRILRERQSQRSFLPYPVDGVVIKVNNKVDGVLMGCTAHHPKSNIAYKFSPQTTMTRCTDIEITVGASGRRTPVAHFEPVIIGGKAICKASLGSERCMEQMDIEVGSVIEVGLSNDVTPKVYGVVVDDGEKEAATQHNNNWWANILNIHETEAEREERIRMEAEAAAEEDARKKREKRMKYIGYGLTALAVLALPFLFCGVIGAAAFIVPAALCKL